MKQKLIILFIILIPINVLSYEVNLHKKITKNAVESSNVSQSLKANMGIYNDMKFQNKKFIEWLTYGSDREDDNLTMRWLNHFYDPITGKGLNTAGIIIYGNPSLQWGKESLINIWSWKYARIYYYQGLTSKDKASRNVAFANAFRALGQVIHLIQDKAVPAHTRNDAHPPFLKTQRDIYEKYTSDHVDLLKYDGYLSVDNLNFNTFEAFWKNNDKGLAEYTNRNFVSRNTNIDDNVYAFPVGTQAWTTTEIAKDADLGGINVEVKYLKGHAIDSYRPEFSAPINRLAAFSYFDYEMEKYNYLQRVYSLNNFVHKEYSDFLIPRAVGYSAGLLNYFFRGSIEITLPDSGVYGQADSPDTGFTEIKLLARNASDNYEQMTDGTFELVIGYRRAIDDPFVNYPEDYAFRADNDISYIVVPEKNGIRSIPPEGPVELTFNLSETPIPVKAINVFLQLIYHGRLGYEEGAVVVGFKDISEPTPVDLFNDMDRICLNGSFYTAGSQDAIDLVDKGPDGNHNNIADEWDVYAHHMTDIYFKFSSPDYPVYASPSDYDISIPSIYAGDSIRVNYILTDYNFLYNSMQSLEGFDPEDLWSHSSSASNLYPGIAIKNQMEYEEDPAVCAPMSAPCHIWWYPTFLEYRGVNLWWGGGIMHINNAYPQGSECTCYQGILRNCITGVKTLKSFDYVRKSNVLKKHRGEYTTEENTLQMLPLMQKQRRMPMDE